MFLTLFKLYKWWQIAQSVSYTDDTEYWKALKEVLVHGRETSHKLTQKQPPEVFYTKAVFKLLQYLQENTCVGVSFQQSCRPKPAGLLKMNPTQVFFL